MDSDVLRAVVHRPDDDDVQLAGRPARPLTTLLPVHLSVAHPEGMYNRYSNVIQPKLTEDMEQLFYQYETLQGSTLECWIQVQPDGENIHYIMGMM